MSRFQAVSFKIPEMATFLNAQTSGEKVLTMGPSSLSGLENGRQGCCSSGEKVIGLRWDHPAYQG